MIVDINISRNTSKTIPSVQVSMHESTLTLPVFRGVKQLISIFYIASNVTQISDIYLLASVFSCSSMGVKPPLSWFFAFLLVDLYLETFNIHTKICMICINNHSSHFLNIVYYARKNIYALLIAKALGEITLDGWIILDIHYITRPLVYNITCLRF